MLGGVEDFLSFSESNLVWQRRRELQKAEQEAAETTFKEGDARYRTSYRDHLIESATYRFEVSLNQHVRYAGLTALVTTVEWCALIFERRATFTLPSKPDKKNRAVHILEIFSSKANLDLSHEISQLESLIHVRNCVVHAAGLIEHYKYKDDLRRGLCALNGMCLSSKNFLGESVEIQAGALEAVIAHLERWLPELEKQCIEKGLTK